MKLWDDCRRKTQRSQAGTPINASPGKDTPIPLLLHYHVCSSCHHATASRYLYAYNYYYCCCRRRRNPHSDTNKTVFDKPESRNPDVNWGNTKMDLKETKREDRGTRHCWCLVSRRQLVNKIMTSEFLKRRRISEPADCQLPKTNAVPRGCLLCTLPTATAL